MCLCVRACVCALVCVRMHACGQRVCGFAMYEVYNFLLCVLIPASTFKNTFNTNVRSFPDVHD